MYLEYLRHECLVIGAYSGVTWKHILNAINIKCISNIYVTNA